MDADQPVPVLMEKKEQLTEAGRYSATSSTPTPVNTSPNANPPGGTADTSPMAAEEGAILLNAMSELVVCQDLDHRIVWANRAACESVRKTLAELIGKHCHEIWHGRDKPCVECAVSQTFRSRQSEMSEVTSPDGRHWLIRGYPILNSEGRLTSVMEIAWNVTQQKRSSDELLKANVLLSKALSELRRTQQQIIEQERLSALGQMASGIAHDFNNALMPIVGFSEFLVANPSTLDNREETIGILQDIRAAAQDARHSVQRLRCFYRPFDVGQLVPLNLNDVVESAIDLTQPRWSKEMGAKGAAIEFCKDLDKIPLIKGSESQIREAITNLLLNALDAMPHGGTITARTRPVGDKVVLEISDTGLGMPEDVRRRCFEPFFSTKGKSGTGMGLAVVFGIVKQLGGTIEVKSELGKGTTFLFSLPVWTASQESPTPNNEAATTIAPRQILVVDDEERSRESIEMLLKKDHHNVTLTASGTEGLQAFREKAFDLVITDRAMPDMSGDFVAATIKQMKPNTPVIMLTGFGELMKDSEEHPPGVDVIMSKPTTPAELNSAIIQVLQSRTRLPA